MAVRIRLQRQGKKGKPFYHIVAADARAKRDGRYIERLGSYNPNTNPATILLDQDRALYWLQNGAESSDTARAILSYKGVLYRNHLLKGVKKGALTEQDAEKKYEEWLADKESKIQAKRDALKHATEKDLTDRLTREREINEARAKEISAANAELAGEVESVTEEVQTEVEEETQAVEPPQTVEEPKAEEAPVEEPKAEEAPVEEPKADEAPVEEPKAEEAPVEEPKAQEAPVEEPKAEEAPVEEPKAEEAPAEEPKAEEAPAEEPKAEEPKAEEAPVEEPKDEEKKD